MMSRGEAKGPTGQTSYRIEVIFLFKNGDAGMGETSQGRSLSKKWDKTRGFMHSGYVTPAGLTEFAPYTAIV